MGEVNIVNNGKPYFFRFDIAKEGGMSARITDYLKTRVNDNGKKVPVKWFDQGQVMNVHGMSPFIQGGVGRYTTDENNELLPGPDVVYRDWQGTPADVTDDGMVYYTLEDQFFCKQGQFKGIFGLRDSNGNVFSSVNIIFEIQGNDFRIHQTTEYYSSELEKMKSKFSNDTQQVIKDARDAYNKQTQATRDALIAKNAEVEEVRAEERIIGNRLINYQDQIDKNDIIKRGEFNQNNESMKNMVQNQLSKISATPIMLADLDSVKEKFPNGTEQLVVTSNGHRAIWTDSQWQDGGIYQSAGIAPETVDIENLKGVYQDETAPNLYSELSSNIRLGGFHKADGTFIPNSDWGEISIGVSPSEQITWNQLTYSYTFWKNDTYVSGGDANESLITVTIPQDITAIKIPVSLRDTDTFKKRDFCIVRGSKIADAYPQNNVIPKTWIPSRNVSLQVGDGMIVGQGTINITFDNEQWYMNLPQESQVVYRSRMMPISNKKVALAGLGHSRGTWIYFNDATWKLQTFSAPNGDSNLISVGMMYDSFEPSSWNIKTNLQLKINNNPKTLGVITNENITPSATIPMISGLGSVQIDTAANTMSFNNLYISYGHTTEEINSNPINIEKIKSGAWLYYDFDVKKIVSSLDENISFNWGNIGAYWYPNHIVLNGNPTIFIDGVKYNASEPLKGHKINVLGDSISQGINTSKSYVSDLKTVTGADLVRNYGVAGASISQKSIDRFEWDNIEPLISSYSRMDQDADVIVIFAGVNDWVYGRQLGDDKSVDITTFYGALNTLLTNLRSQYVGATIILVTPLQTDWTTRPANGVDDTSGKNVEGLYLKDYVDAIKKSASKYAVPVLDLYSSMFYPFNKDFKDKYMTDSLHPTRAGHILLADRIGKFINEKV